MDTLIKIGELILILFALYILRNWYIYLFSSPLAKQKRFLRKLKLIKVSLIELRYRVTPPIDPTFQDEIKEKRIKQTIINTLEELNSAIYTTEIAIKPERSEEEDPNIPNCWSSEEIKQLMKSSL